MPLAYYNKQGKLTRYNLRKFTELPFQLVRCFRYKDLYDNVLFNYQWLYNKMCALPLPEVLGDFEDAIKNIRKDPMKNDTVHKEISLVADSLRLGGAILKFYPGMLAAQLVSRLLPEIEHSENIRNLLRQCDEEGIKQNALVPTYHCMHTPGGPLKYSLEGYQFAIFAMKLTPDNRYIISVSNKFITFDAVTSDLARQVYPKVEGLMIGLELSPDNKFAAAFTNNDQTILLIYGQKSWNIFDQKGNLMKKSSYEGEGEILKMMMDSLDNYSLITWSGDSNSPDMRLQSYRGNIPANPLQGHCSLVINQKQTRAFICETPGSFKVASHVYRDGFWVREREFDDNQDKVLMLGLSKNEKWCYATLQNGFKIWNITDGHQVKLRLPPGVRNISKSLNKSSSLVISRNDILAVSGIRQEIIVWSMSSATLVKRLNAHFQRIVEIKSLVTGNENCVITSSIDRSIKVWDLDYIFEKEQHIDKHELTIDSLSISTKAQIAVVVTRSCIGIWDFMTGKLKFKLANSALGAIITQAIVNEEGSYVVAAESGELLYWDLNTRKVVFCEKQEDIQQIFFYKNQTRCIVVSKKGKKGDLSAIVVSRSFPGGEKQWEAEYPFASFIKVVMSSNEHHIICYDADKTNHNLNIFNMKNGNLLTKFSIKYPGFKEVIKLVALPDKPSVVATIDVDKGNLIDIAQKKFIKSIPCWDGTCSKDGRYGLYAPSTGGMEMLDLRTGKGCKTLIPKISEGIFDVMAVFNATNEYVLYYHSGRKTIRAFRRKDGTMIANFRVQADLKGMETTADGRSVVLGMDDGSMTTLTIADPDKPGITQYLKSLPSRK